MTLQRVMEIVIGKEAATKREQLSSHLSANQQLTNAVSRPQQSRRPKTNPDVAPVFRGEVLSDPAKLKLQENLVRNNLLQSEQKNQPEGIVRLSEL